LPDYSRGRFSRWNIDGREIVRRDLEKQEYYHSFEAPDWDGLGTHTVTQVRRRYPREFLPPRLNTLKVEIINEDSETIVVRVILSEILNRKDLNFLHNLFYAINLMQENIGAIDVIESGESSAEYLQTLFVDWQIFPPGERDRFISSILSGRSHSREEREAIIERVDFIHTLKPKKLISGQNSFNNYFGAEIADNLYVFECSDYGNACYIMYDNWEELCKRSRIELMSGVCGNNFDRVIHRGRWQDKVKWYLKKKITA
jgi:hypothetical protein